MTDIGSLNPLNYSTPYPFDLMQLLELVPDAMIMVNQAGVMTMVNHQAELMFGYPREELVGQSLEQLLPERFREIHRSHREGYFAAAHARSMGIGLQLFGLQKDGIEFPVDISLSPFQLDAVPHIIAAIRDVTAQKRLERERLQQIQHIQLQSELINQAHDAILVRDPISRILLWNQGAERLYGWTTQEALGRITYTLLKTRSPLSRSALDAHLAQEGIWEGELVHTCRDGHTVLVESRQVLVRNQEGQPQAILEINRDITQRRQREQADQVVHAETVAQLSFLQQVLDAMPGSVYLVTGEDARLVMANHTASQMWGARWQINQPMHEFLARNHIEITNEQGYVLPPKQWATLRALQQREPVLSYQEIIRRANGSNLSVLVNALPLGTHLTDTYPLKHIQPAADAALPSDLPLALVVHQDVSPLKEAEYLKDEFIGIAAHELRTPLAVLTGYADMLLVQTARGRGPTLADWQQEALGEIKQATQRLTTLTEELLDVTRLQAGQLTLQRTPTNLVPLLQQLVARLQRTTTQHQFEIHLPPEPLVALLDAHRMEQIVTNLLENAIKYSPQGGKIVIVLRAEEPARTLCLSVRDSGIGIPRHQQAQIFGRFVRADNARAWGIGGTGLGLYLCRELVERHAGHLWFESEEGKGTTFFMQLPLVEGNQQSTHLSV